MNFTEEERQELIKTIIAADYHDAAALYTEQTGKHVSPVYLRHIITGRKQGRSFIRHDPEQVLSVFAEVIEQRREKKQKLLRRIRGQEAAA